jgi:hypothetical protein
MSKHQTSQTPLLLPCHLSHSTLQLSRRQDFDLVDVFDVNIPNVSHMSSKKNSLCLKTKTPEV